METTTTAAVAMPPALPRQKSEPLSIQTNHHRRQSSSGLSEAGTMNSSATEYSPTTVSHKQNIVAKVEEVPTSPPPVVKIFPRSSMDADEMSPRATTFVSASNVHPLRRPSEVHMNDIERGAPGDGSLVKHAPEHARKKSQFYSEVFSIRDNDTTNVRDRVSGESVLVAELKTNVILRDEAAIISELSMYLASRYQRSESSVMIQMTQGACLYMGGSFQPAYHLTLRGVPSLFQSTLNKRNAALIQTFLSAELHVPPSRGILKFDPVPEGNFATNGQTVLSEIESQGGKVPALGRSASRSRKGSLALPNRSSISASSDSPISRRGSAFKQRNGPMIPNNSKDRALSVAKERGLSISPAVMEEGEHDLSPRMKAREFAAHSEARLDDYPEQAQKMPKRKSIMNLFSR